MVHVWPRLQRPVVKLLPLFQVRVPSECDESSILRKSAYIGKGSLLPTREGPDGVLRVSVRVNQERDGSVREAKRVGEGGAEFSRTRRSLAW